MRFVLLLPFAALTACGSNTFSTFETSQVEFESVTLTSEDLENLTAEEVFAIFGGTGETITINGKTFERPDAVSDTAGASDAQGGTGSTDPVGQSEVTRPQIPDVLSGAELQSLTTEELLDFLQTREIPNRIIAERKAIEAAKEQSGVTETEVKDGFAFSEFIRIGNLGADDADRIIGTSELGTSGIPGTAFAQIPTTGEASFAGPGFVSIGDLTTTTEGTNWNALVTMVGEANVTYNFSSDTFSGDITDFVAMDISDEVQGLIDGTNLPPSIEELDPFAQKAIGSILITNGIQSSPLDRPTELTATASGTVSAFGESYTINVPLEGLLRGTNPSTEIPVKAISLQGERGNVEGTDFEAVVDIATDKVGSSAGAFVNRP